MHHILLVDDEPILIDGLMAAFTDCPELDLDIYKAYSGREALEILSSVRMDVVISDIRMPGMDGLELLSRIHADWPQCQVIFLSGYSEFDVVYRAIQSTAVTFLLKTEGFDKIIDTLRDTLEKRDAALEVARKAERFAAQQALTRHIIQREALSSLLVEGEMPAGNCLPLRQGEDVLMLYAYIEQGASDWALEEFQTQLLSVDGVLREQLSCYPLSICFWNRRDDLLWCIQPDKGLDITRCAVYVRENLELIQDGIKRRHGMTLAFAMRGSPCTIQNMPSAFRWLKKQACSDTGVPGMIFVGSASSDDVLPLVPQSALTRLSSLMEHRNRAAFSDFLKDTLLPLRGVAQTSDVRAVEGYLSISRLLLSLAEGDSPATAPLTTEQLETLSNPGVFASWNEAADYLEAQSDLLLREMDRTSGGNTRTLMRKICSYIDAHLHDQNALSLSSIAEKSFFNPAYLSRLFHQMTGQTISEYIAAARVRKANELLCDARNKVGSVGEAVGFSSSANFTRFYRKMTGCTPQEYRDHLTETTLQKRHATDASV